MGEEEGGGGTEGQEGRVEHDAGEETCMKDDPGEVTQLVSNLTQVTILNLCDLYDAGDDTRMIFAHIIIYMQYCIKTFL